MSNATNLYTNIHISKIIESLQGWNEIISFYK